MKFKIIANWKMYPKSLKAADILAKKIKDSIIPIVGYEVVICPPYPYFCQLDKELRLTSIGLGAQNIHPKLIGRNTGEVSVSMIKEYCQYTIVGHSERREQFGEDNKLVNEKVLTALDQGISPIVCVGETLEDYRKGESDLVVEHMKECLKNVRREDIDKVVVCYEPIWAISSDKGKNPADADYANQMVMLLRQGLAAIYNRELAYEVPIIYGGSVDSSDVANYQNQPEINGVLVGSASLDANEFIKICDRIKENS